VAVFAMSNYLLTIGRIAKLFNPMLSETFEYVRFDKQYHYVSEQVNHHPSIFACWAESPSWHHYGDVDAQNKFMERDGDGYLRALGKAGEGKVVEHYGWKNVTTNISGFIPNSSSIPSRVIPTASSSRPRIPSRSPTVHATCSRV